MIGASYLCVKRVQLHGSDHKVKAAHMAQPVWHKIQHLICLFWFYHPAVSVAMSVWDIAKEASLNGKDGMAKTEHVVQPF